MKTLVRIQKDVPLTIFDEPILAKQLNKLFKDSEEKFKSRVDEIVKFLESDFTDKLSYENIASLFKLYFFEFILNEAIEITLAGRRNYDILTNISSLLSEKSLETAIMGKPMIDAFIRAISNIPVDGNLSKIYKGSLKITLEKEFLGEYDFLS